MLIVWSRTAVKELRDVTYLLLGFISSSLRSKLRGPRMTDEGGETVDELCDDDVSSYSLISLVPSPKSMALRRFHGRGMSSGRSAILEGHTEEN